jgi:hypothetical protein
MIASSPQAKSQAAGTSPGKVRTGALQQDDRGPLDCELLDLYVAILIAVPLACFLRYLWS